MIPTFKDQKEGYPLNYVTKMLVVQEGLIYRRAPCGKGAFFTFFNNFIASKIDFSGRKKWIFAPPKSTFGQS